jgi:uncharacterized membrane protein
MILGQTGESRVRGYLYVLERSLRTFLPREVVADAVREVESHILERVATVEARPDERDALERVLAELGSPLHVARAYADQLAVDEAVTTGRVVTVARAVLRVAATGVAAFFAAVALFVGYVVGIAFALIAILQPIFPGNVGLWTRGGVPISFGAQFPPPADAVLITGYWIIPLAVVISVSVLLLTHRVARSWLRRWRESTPSLLR